MGMILTERPDYFGESTKVSYGHTALKALKRTGDFLITFSPISWILFFGLLAILIKLLC